MIKDRKKIIHIAEGKLRKEKNLLINTCGNTFQTLFHCSPLFFLFRIRIEPNQKLLSRKCTMVKKTIPKLIIFIFQRYKRMKKKLPRMKTKKIKLNVALPSRQRWHENKTKRTKNEHACTIPNVIVYYT